MGRPGLGSVTLIAAILVSAVLSAPGVARQPKNPVESKSVGISDSQVARDTTPANEAIAEPEPTTACCAAACIGGGKCGIYCEEITVNDPCESRYRFDCPPGEALVCQGGSCICVH